MTSKNQNKATETETDPEQTGADTVGQATTPATPVQFAFVKAVEKIERKSKPNPFVDAVKGLTVDSEEGLSFDTPNMKGIESQLDAAGEANGVSVRRKITPSEDGKSFHVFFRAVTKITRKKKDAAPETASDAASE